MWLKLFTMRTQLLLCLSIVVSQAATGQAALKIQNGTTMKMSGGVQVTISNLDLNNDGIISQAPGDGQLRFAGTANQVIAGSGTFLFDVMHIAKQNNSMVSLESNITIGSTLNFTSGLLNLNSRTLALASNAVLNGETGTSRILGNSGYVEITRNLNAPSSENPGNLGLIISSAANLGNTVIRRGHASQVNGYGNGNSVARYYDVTPANNTALNATLRFNYLDEELNGLGEGGLVLWRRVLPNWISEGFTLRNTTSNYVEKSGVNSLSRLTLSTLFNPLPVTFLSLNLRCDNGQVTINWKTAQEINVMHFQIQRSTNGITWETIGQLPASGNSSGIVSHSFTDINPVNNGLYRIASVDLGGSTQYTSIIRSACGARESFTAWPNPVKDKLFVNLTSPNNTTVVLRITDSKGVLIKTQQQSLLQGTNQAAVDMSSLAAGTYYLTAIWENGRSSTIRLIK